MDHATAKYDAREAGKIHYAHLRECERCRRFTYGDPTCREHEEFKNNYADKLNVLAKFNGHSAFF